MIFTKNKAQTQFKVFTYKKYDKKITFLSLYMKYYNKITRLSVLYLQSQILTEKIMKKSILIAIVLFSITTAVQAQSIRFGIKAGANFANQNGDTPPAFESKESITSYHAGLLAEVKLFDSFAIQPELLYSTQGATYKNAVEEFNNELGYLSIPVLAKFYLSKSLSLELGPQASFLLSERKNVNLEDPETFEFGVAGGLGLNITKNLFVQARYGLGLTEASKDADIKNSTIQLSAGIMF